MKYSFLLLQILLGSVLQAQELYVNSEPASNVPARSLSFKYGGKWLREKSPAHEHISSRHMLESSMGISKNLMLRPAITFGNMYNTYPDQQQKFESVSLYLKYRFLSVDEIHKHFRASFYAKGLYSRNSLLYDELTIDGDQSAFQFGLIATQLINKLAISATGSIHQVLDGERFLKYGGPRRFGYQAFNYSLSSGYLLLPKTYKSYEQTNFNIYMEVLGGIGLDRKYDFMDLAPAVQLIFKSSSKLNLGYRFQIEGNAYRMARSSAYLSFEKTLLNKLGKRKR
jgi:hypothetical protein